MKPVLISRCIIILMVFFCTLHAMNEPSVISDLSVNVRSSRHLIEIRYRLEDMEDDSIQITLNVTLNGAPYVFTPEDSLTGDIGFPVAPGPDKEIVWNYPAKLDLGGSDIYQIELTVDDLYELDIPSVISEIDTGTVLAKLRVLEGDRNNYSNYWHLESARNYIEGLFNEYNLKTWRQKFTYWWDDYANIIADQNGTDGDTAIVINAHFDTVEYSPGADDNASGVVGVLEAARILSRYQFRHKIQYIAFDLEEEGFVGDEEYVDIVQFVNRNILGVINLDMIGYYSDEPNSQTVPYPEMVQYFYPDLYNQLEANEFRGDFILIMANLEAGNIVGEFERCAAEYIPDLKFMSMLVPEYLADYFGGYGQYPWWGAGYDAFMLNDGGGEYRNPHYHSQTDRIETLNLPFMVNVIRATVAATIEMAGFVHSTVITSDPFAIETMPLDAAGQAWTKSSAPYGLVYADTLEVTGGIEPYTWSLFGGTLPSGLDINSNGTLTGVPAASGSFQGTLLVQDASIPPDSLFLPFDFQVTNDPPVIVYDDTVRITKDDNLIFDIDAEDPNGNPVGLTFMGYPAWLLVTDSQLTGTVPDIRQDTCFTVIASDGDLADTLTVILQIILPVAVQKADEMPVRFALSDVYPNPFNQRAVIQVSLPVETSLMLQVFDIRGRLVRTLYEGRTSGIRRFSWDGNGLASGIYFIQMLTPEFHARKRCVLLK